MKLTLSLGVLVLFMVLALGISPAGARAATLSFGGYEWSIRSGRGGPGPNTWDPQNVWLDDQGRLHLRIRRQDDQWSCAEVTLSRRLGFGRYQFQIVGRIDQLDDHVVLGLFNYPSRDVGDDGTNEIDIEFARWGNPRFPLGNYTVWPVEKALKPTSKTFEFHLTGDASTHRFDWSSTQVLYRSLQGHRDDDEETFASWSYGPVDAPKRIAGAAMPVHLNLWLFQGRPPKDGKEVEVIVANFKFLPR